jgi:hypothetical protein
MIIDTYTHNIGWNQAQASAKRCSYSEFKALES